MAARKTKKEPFMGSAMADGSNAKVTRPSSKQKRTAKPKGSKPRQRSSGRDERLTIIGSGEGAKFDRGPKGRGDASFDAGFITFERSVASRNFDEAFSNKAMQERSDFSRDMSKEAAKNWYGKAARTKTALKSKLKEKRQTRTKRNKPKDPGGW